MKGFGAGRAFLAAAAALLAACAIGCVPCDSCGGDKDTTSTPGNGGGTGGSGGGGSVPGLNIVCSDGQAWVACASGLCNALIFKSNNEVVVANKNNDGVWYVDYYNCGVYSVSGNKVTITYAYGASSRAFLFTLNGITLTVAPADGSGSGSTFTKTSGIYPVGVDSPVTSGVGIACANGEGWVNCEDGPCRALVFKLSGDVAAASTGEDGYWYFNKEDALDGVRYSVNGNKLTIIGDGGSILETITFNISGSTMTAVSVLEGETVYYRFTKTSGIHPLNKTDTGGGDSHVHQWGGWTIIVRPTCASNGIATRVCALNPSHIETTTTLPLFGEECEPDNGGGGAGGGTGGGGGGTHVHTYGDWTVTVPPTCTAPGVMTRTCTADGYQDTHEIPRLTGAACNSGGGGVVGGNNCTSAGTCRTVLMPDGKRWTAENLNVVTADSWCYENSADSCNKYGRLYTWAAAMSACQSVGWRLPDTADWRRLVEATGRDTAAKNLKATSGWYNYINITGVSQDNWDDFGFSALPGGYRFSTGGSFHFAGSTGYWWTATESYSGFAYYRNMGYSYDRVNNGDDFKVHGLAVRCVEE